MGADQVAAIRPALVELEDDEKSHSPGGEARYFARFSVPQKDDVWAEVYLEDETIVNLSFPFQDEPMDRLKLSGIELLPGGRVMDTTTGEYCTLAFHRVPTMTLARFVDALFSQALKCGDDYGVDVSILRFPE